MMQHTGMKSMTRALQMPENSKESKWIQFELRPDGKINVIQRPRIMESVPREEKEEKKWGLTQHIIH